MSILVLAPPGDVRLLDVDTFRAGVTAHWGGQVAKFDVEVLGGKSLHWALIAPEGDKAFHLRLSEHGDAVTADGTDEQNADVAAWVRSLLPPAFQRVIVCDDAFTWHVDLDEGITAAQVLDGRVDHSDPNWTDPDLT